MNTLGAASTKLNTKAATSVSHPKRTFLWAYFLRGGSYTDPNTRYIHPMWGDPLIGHVEFFDWCRRAIDQGADGIYLQNPGGVDTLEGIAPPMYADQFLKCKDQQGMGPQWVEDFTTELSRFIHDTRKPVLCYQGGMYGSGFDGATRANFESFAEECYAPVKIPGVQIGYDSSAIDNPSGFAEAVRKRNSENGYMAWVEPYWLAGHEYMNRYGCIVTESHYNRVRNATTVGTNGGWSALPGSRCIRILDEDPLTEIREARLRTWFKTIKHDKHEPAIPAHHWVKEGLNVRNIWKEVNGVEVSGL